MTKHRKHSQTIKALQKQSEINLSGNYLREKNLIDSLSCKIEEKFSLTNVIPAKINIPYPKIQVKSKNERYADILSRDFCSSVSELTAVMQYTNHEIRFKQKYCKAANIILSISKIEMMHMQMIGELIVLLGGSINYSYFNNGSYTCWTPEYVDLGTNYVNMLLLDINDEYKAIRQYEEHIKAIDDNCIKAILDRIIKDEKYHIELLTRLLDDKSYKYDKD